MKALADDCFKAVLESKIQADIIKYLKGIPDLVVVKKDAGAYSKAGVSDLLISFRGHFIAMEVKRPGEKPTKLQEKFLRDVAGSGGLSTVVYSLDDAKEFIDRLRDGVFIHNMPGGMQ